MPVYLWTADDKFARRLEVVDGLLVEILMWNDAFNDMLHQVTAQLVNADLLRVLHGDDNGMNTQRHTGTLLHPVLAGNLSTAQLHCIRHSHQLMSELNIVDSLIQLINN